MDQNKFMAIGKLEGDPQMSEQGNRKQAHFILIVNRRMQNANGQWVDVPVHVPIFAFEKKAETVGQYVKAGQEVSIEAYYQNWKAADGTEGHGMMIERISFGYRPKAQN